MAIKYYLVKKYVKLKEQKPRDSACKNLVKMCIQTSNKIKIISKNNTQNKSNIYSIIVNNFYK